MEIIWSIQADEILSEGKFMEDGIQNWSLTRCQALNVLSKLQLAKIGVLGGDVCTFQNGRIFPNGDNWYCEPSLGESMTNFLTRSINEARVYVDSYPDGEDETIYFNIVPNVETLSIDVEHSRLLQG